MAETSRRTRPVPALHSGEDAVERRTFRDYLIILRERSWIALPLALFVSLGHAYRELQTTPLFAARATMQFEKPDTVVAIQNVVDTSVRSDVDMNTHLEILRSTRLAAEVRASLTPAEQRILTRPAHRRSPPGTDPANLPVDLGSMSAAASRASYIMSLNVTHEDPEAAALVANRYVDSFLRYLLSKGSAGNNTAVRFLTTQAERLRLESEEANQALQRYMREKNLLSLDSSTNLVTEQFKRAAAHREECRFRLAQIDEKARQIDSFRSAGRNLLEIAEIGTHPLVSPLNQQLIRLRQEISLLEERYLELHPAILAKGGEIAVTESDLARSVSQAVAELRTRQAEAAQNLRMAEADYARAERAQIDLTETSIAYGSLKTEADTKEQNHRAILARLNEAKTVGNIENAPVRPLDRATISHTPVSPDKARIARTSAGLGVIVFLVVAVGLSVVDDRVKSAWDVESFIGADLLGIVPDLGPLKESAKHALLTAENSDPGAEAFLGVYSSMRIRSRLDFPKSILVTSTLPGEGKTLVSCNIAGSFARHGRRTLLIDGDLRRPMLHRHFSLENDSGLVRWFEAGPADPADPELDASLGITVVAPRLSLLRSGGRSRSPTAILEHPSFALLLEQLKRRFDVVIIDSPPLGAVSDSMLIANRSDEVVYVCRFNRACRKHVRLFMRSLRDGRNEVLGVVLNGISHRRIEYYSSQRYHRSYRKYYGSAS